MRNNGCQQLTERCIFQYAAGSLAHDLILSEYQSAQKLFTIIPRSTPRPIAWGSLDTEPLVTSYFLVLEFVEFETDGLPDLVETVDLVRLLHTSEGARGTRFGSPIPTFDGVFCHSYGWTEDWLSFFRSLLGNAFLEDEATNGFDLEISSAHAILQARVIPRLLQHLEAGDGRIQPTFIHGDLWEGNIRKRKDTGELVIFDSNGYYAHHEMELAYWATNHHQMHEKDYCDLYLKCSELAHPLEEAKDRVLLYSLKPYFMYSAHARGHRSREW